MLTCSDTAGYGLAIMLDVGSTTCFREARIAVAVKIAEMCETKCAKPNRSTSTDDGAYGASQVCALVGCFNERDRLKIIACIAFKPIAAA